MKWVKNGSSLFCGIGERRKQRKSEFHVRKTELGFFCLPAVCLMGLCQFFSQDLSEIVKDMPGCWLECCGAPTPALPDGTGSSGTPHSLGVFQQLPDGRFILSNTNWNFLAVQYSVRINKWNLWKICFSIRIYYYCR